MSPVNARAYAKTHPWLTFNFSLNEIKFDSWLLLGEAMSKCEHLAGVPLDPEVARHLNSVYLSKGIHGTTSIEGNTLSEEEVLLRIEGDLELPKSREYLGREIDNILAASNDILGDVAAGAPIELTPDRIKEFNRRILDGLPLMENVIPGETRTHSVVVGIGQSYRGAPAEDCDYLLDRLCSWLNNDLVAPESRPDLVFPIAVLRAVLAHLYIAWIHPFGDGNGRTARLIEVQLLIQAGVPTPAAHLLSDHYNQTRDAYLVELSKTSRGHFPLSGFINYALQGFVDELREQIQTIQKSQLEVSWRDFVHKAFADQETPAKVRQKHLVLDLEPGSTVSKSRIPGVSHRLTLEYAGKSSKTVTRDVNELLAKRLLIPARGGYKTNQKILEAFMPLRAEQ